MEVITTPIAVILLIGFLGVRKITLLHHILNEQHGFKIAVIESEFDEVSVDDQLTGDRATQIETLTNDYICCTRFNELEDAPLDLLDSRDHGEIESDRLVIECTGMADPGPIIQTFSSHEVSCECYLLDGTIVLVDTVHVDQQMDQFIIAQSQVSYASRTLLAKTDAVGNTEKLCERPACINARASAHIVIHGDIDPSQLFNTSGFMLEEKVVSAAPRFHFVTEKQNDASSIMIELDCPVDISGVSQVMENLLLSLAGQLMHYKGMPWIDGEPNRPLFQGVRRLYSADWDRSWGDETPYSMLVFIGIQLSEEEICAALTGLRC